MAITAPALSLSLYLFRILCVCASRSLLFALQHKREHVYTCNEILSIPLLILTFNIRFDWSIRVLLKESTSLGFDWFGLNWLGWLASVLVSVACINVICNIFTMMTCDELSKLLSQLSNIHPFFTMNDMVLKLFERKKMSLQFVYSSLDVLSTFWVRIEILNPFPWLAIYHWICNQQERSNNNNSNNKNRIYYLPNKH